MAKKSPLLIPLAVAGAAALAFFYTRKASAAEKTGSLPIDWEDGSWTLGENFNVVLNEKLSAMYPSGPSLPVDSLAISWAVLSDEVPSELGYPAAPRAPDDSDWQADTPGLLNYFEGAGPVLGLIHHVAGAISF